jgi:hypothetical protein
MESVGGSSGDSNEPSPSVKGGEFLDLAYMLKIYEWLKISLRTGTKISEQFFITKLGMPSSPTDFHGHSRFMAFRTSEFEVGAKDKTLIDWIIKEKFQSRNYYKPTENALAISRGLFK